MRFSDWLVVVCTKLRPFLNVSDLSLDSKLELLKLRDYAEYTYRSLAEHKDGRFKGQWRNAKPHGRYITRIIVWDITIIIRLIS